MYPREMWNQFENNGPRTNNNCEAYNEKLGCVINKPNPNIWWFLDLIKSEDTHFTLAYYRLLGEKNKEKDFKERPRNRIEIQKDLELAKLKNRYLKQELDAIELNRRASYYMNDYSGKKSLLKMLKILIILLNA